MVSSCLCPCVPSLLSFLPNWASRQPLSQTSHLDALVPTSSMFSSLPAVTLLPFSKHFPEPLHIREVTAPIIGTLVRVLALGKEAQSALASVFFVHKMEIAPLLSKSLK